MSRRRKNQNLLREVREDPVFQDMQAARFINKLMWDGKKEKARRIFYKALESLKKSPIKEEPFQIFTKALENCKPGLEVRSRRIGGATYQVPSDVRPSRKLALAMRWLIFHARKRKEKTMALRLAGELADARNNRGGAIKKKEDLHRMAESNRAFSHYNW